MNQTYLISYIVLTITLLLNVALYFVASRPLTHLIETTATKK